MSGERVSPGIRGFLETSFVDWPGRICAVVFFGGCNFRCPFCHNYPLVLAPDSLPLLSPREIVNRLGRFRKWLSGVCISGGEPTMDPELPAVLQLFREAGWSLKLDTNGFRPGVLEYLLAEGLVDMIAMDVKAPLRQEKYNRCAGTKVDLARIRRSIELIRASGVEHEFRMTVLPRFHDESDIETWRRDLGGGGSLKLQNFNPQAVLDTRLRKETAFEPEDFARLQSLVAA